MKVRSIVLPLAVVAALVAPPAYAHHGPTAYDLTKTISSQAVVTSLTWANPHCLLNFDIRDASGVVTSWSIELYNPLYLTRAGWTRDTVKSGDEITVAFHPAKNGGPTGYIRAGAGRVVLRGQELSLVPR